MIFITASAGCKKSNAVEGVTEPIPDDVFPLTPGHRFEFTGYLTQEGTETKIPGSDEGFSANWTITQTTSLAAVFPAPLISGLTPSSAILIIDTVSVPNVLTKATPVFVYYDESNKEYHYLTNFGYVFRSNFFLDSANGNVRGDSLRFLTLASLNQGLGAVFSVFEGSFNSYRFSPTNPVKVSISVTGKFERQETLNLTVNGRDTTFSAYYLVITNTASVPGISPQSSITAKFWLADGIGPVQMFLAGDAETPGSFRTLKTKNF